MLAIREYFWDDWPAPGGGDGAYVRTHNLAVVFVTTHSANSWIVFALLTGAVLMTWAKGFVR